MEKSALLLLVMFLFLGTNSLLSQEPSNADLLKEMRQNEYNLQHRLDILEKKIDDVLWYEKIGDLAFVDKVFLAGEPPRGHETAKTLMGKNPVKIWAYVFIPKNVDASAKYPLIVLPHGGVHGDFNTYYTHIVRELMAQQYIVVAPEYRGSAGYGRLTYERIDYGGLENSDVDMSRQYMVDNYSIVDRGRVGLVGWSHGGMITLMNIFDKPENYTCAFAGVPVSDLVARMGYSRPDYEDYFSASYHIGDKVYENIDEYRRRSPVFHAHKLQTPLLIHTNTNDEDVHVIEVENLINALKAHNKKFEYKIFQDVPGGHSFDRMDHARAREIRFQIYKFLEKHLNPPVKFKNQKEMEKAAYRF